MPLSEVPARPSEPDRSVLAIDAALQQLERADPRNAELVQMRYFPVHAARRELRLAKAWLRREMSAGQGRSKLSIK